MDFLNLGRKFFLLAPMSGYSNAACRRIFREYGADATLSEFVHARAVLSGAKRVMEKLQLSHSERPAGIQIFGSEPSEMAEAACAIEEKFAPDFLDINYGCPAPAAVDCGAGAALLKDVEKMRAIAKAVVSVVKTPVTAKIRSGWDMNNIVAPHAALELEQAGVKMLTLHARTRSRAYEGDADWLLIERVAESLQIPVVGNGSAEKLSAEYLRSSACAGFMVGRFALGNPWVFPDLKAKLLDENFVETQITADMRARLALRYAEIECECGSSNIDAQDLTYAKSRIIRFIKGCSGFKKVRAAMRDVQTMQDLKGILCEYL